MEPVSFTVGVIGLAGLFSSCLEAIDKVQTYRSFGSDSHVLDTRFKATRVRLEKWGQRVGFSETALSDHHHPAFDDGDISTAVQDIFQIISTICGASDASTHRSNRAAAPSDGASLGLLQPRPHGARRRKLTWALWGKTERTDQVELLEQLVQQLHNLVPDVVQDTQPARELNTRQSDNLASGSDNAWPTELKRVLARFEAASKAETRREVHSWLGCSSPNECYHDSIQKRLTGTCDWIFRRSAFQNWLKQECPADANLLWINGPAGFGKTVLCARVVQNLSSTLETPVAYFFFSSALESRDDPFVAIRSWIFQVMSQHDGAFEHVHQVWEADLDPIASRATAITIFTKLLHVVPGCIFIVDGLDECTSLDNSTTSVTQFLRTITTVVAGTNTRVLIISRAEPEIRHALTDDVIDNFAEYEISLDDVRSDTAAYSKDVVDRKLPNKSDDFRSSLAEAMTDQCEGQFLWLKMQERSLRKGMNKKQLQCAIKETPVGLDQLYDRSWQRITLARDSEKQRIYTLLRWAAFALRPLTICEVTQAVLIDEDEELPIDDLPDDVDDDYIESEIVDLCGPLLEVRSQDSDTCAGLRTVHLTHFSVKQYLLYNLPIPSWVRENERLRGEYQNTLLAKACLHYVNSHRVWQGSPDPASYLGTAFRDYAAMFWHHHVRSGLRTDGEMVALTMRFFDGSNQAWQAWRTWFNEQGVKFRKLGTEFTSPGPLYYAADLELTDVVSALIKDRSCDPNERNCFGTSALEVACEKGSRDVVEILLDANANPSTTGKNGWTPLLIASNYGHFEVVKLLIEKSASIMFTDVDGWTPIHAASLNGDLEVVKLLIEKHASVTVPDVAGWTPLHLASSYGHVEVARLLIKAGANSTTRTRTKDGMVPLHLAVSRGYLGLVKLLIEEGADIRVTSKNGWSPIHFASEHGNIDVVKLLINEGSDVDAITSDYGWSPLYIAAYQGRIDIVKLLINEGSDVNVITSDGWTPLHIAAYRGRIDIVKLLIDEGAETAVISIDGWTLLHAVSEHGHVEIVKLLLRTPGVEVGKIDNLGRTALFFASRHGYTNVVQALLADGRVDPEAKDWFHTTSLFAAVRNGHSEVVELLLATERINIEDQDGFGRNLFWWARHIGNLRVFQLLVQHAEKVDIPIPTPDDVAPTEGTSLPFDHQCGWCDACTLNVENTHGYSCKMCHNGLFRLCVECFEGGVRCPNSSHDLVAR